MNKRIDTLIAGLHSKEGIKRKYARHALAKIGKPAVPFLISLITDPCDQMRWEACKALVSIKDPSAAGPLVVALSDESSEVRWLAAKALIALKSAAVVPLLEALQEHFDSPDFRQGAHHVLHALEKKKLLNQDARAVLDKLGDPEPNLTVPWVAKKALDSIGNTRQ